MRAEVNTKRWHVKWIYGDTYNKLKAHDFKPNFVVATSLNVWFGFRRWPAVHERVSLDLWHLAYTKTINQCMRIHKCNRIRCYSPFIRAAFELQVSPVLTCHRSSMQAFPHPLKEDNRVRRINILLPGIDEKHMCPKAELTSKPAARE